MVFAIRPEAEEPVVALVERVFGVTPAVYLNSETGEVRVSVYTELAEAALGELRRELVAGLESLRAAGVEPGDGVMAMAVRAVRREDWAESWKKHFKPLAIGGSLLIRPSWSRRRARAGQAEVVLDPGLSFGTGQHATTSFCLRQLVKHRPRSGAAGRGFLDMGTGSGILAIAAAKLGYGPVVAFDFDPEAVRVARENARQNGVGGSVRMARQDLTKVPVGSRARYDVVCANLIFDLLIAECERVVNRVKPDGVLVLAGILETQFERVVAAYAGQGLRLVATQVEKEWQSGSFVRAGKMAEK
ncbi:ribosomal protein L11 methyltransferase [Verrucomicrobiota bacterium]|nr:ribosomal protein L11 methyltransferase [Verrucomicrobiota bacterium]